MTHRWLGWILLSGALLAAVPGERAAAGEAFGRDGLLVRLSVLQRSVQGDFDGTSVLTDSSIEADGSGGWDTEAFTVPELEAGTGVALEVGLRSLPWSVGVGASRSSHAGRWQSLAQGARFKTAFGEARYALLSRWRAHPEVTLGLDFNRIEVDDGAQTDSDLGPAAYKGLGLRLGGGLVVHATRSMFFSGDLAYRWAWYDRIEGVLDTERRLVDARSGDGWEIGLSVGLVVWRIPWSKP